MGIDVAYDTVVQRRKCMQILQVQNNDVMGPGLVDRRAKGELGTGIWAVKVRPQDFRHSFDASACGDGPTPDFEIERL